MANTYGRLSRWLSYTFCCSFYSILRRDIEVDVRGSFWIKSTVSRCLKERKGECESL